MVQILNNLVIVNFPSNCLLFRTITDKKNCSSIYLSGDYNEQVGHYPEPQFDRDDEMKPESRQQPSPPVSSNRDKSSQWKSTEFLQQIEAKLIRISVNVQLKNLMRQSSNILYRQLVDYLNGVLCIFLMLYCSLSIFRFT
jgi:hypothetical protein